MSATVIPLFRIQERAPDPLTIPPPPKPVPEPRHGRCSRGRRLLHGLAASAACVALAGAVALIAMVHA
jgi:hypothetical protein